jgi:hypothetical protein
MSRECTRINVNLPPANTWAARRRSMALRNASHEDQQTGYFFRLVIFDYSQRGQIFSIIGYGAGYD